MSSRTIQHPGIELNEIDRSQYGKVDYSLPNAPTSLVCGFADQGEDLALTWINTKQNLDDTYGNPTNEYEKYFYNGICEVLNRGGTCIAAKLPYDNIAKDKYNYVEFAFSNVQNILNSPIDGQYATLTDIHDTLAAYLSARGYVDYDISTIKLMHDVIYSFIQQEQSKQSQDVEDLSNDNLFAMRDALCTLVENYYVQSQFAPLIFSDSNLTSYIEISNVNIDSYNSKDSIESLDQLLTNSRKVRKGTMRIYDMTRSEYKSLDSYQGCVRSDVTISSNGISTNDCVGIIPVIVTAPNALFFQQMLNFDKEHDNLYSIFNSLSGYSTVNTKYSYPAELSNLSIETDFKDISSHVSLPIASLPDKDTDSNGSDYDSLSKRAALQFPQISYKGNGHFDQQYLKQIGIAVFKAFVDIDNNGMLGFELLESFVGSLDPSSRDPITKAGTFIDDVVNSKSNYIRLFSNIDKYDYEKTAMMLTSCQKAMSIGFYNRDCLKKIQYQNSIAKPLTYLLDNASNKNTLPLDLVIDAGMSNIAQIASMQLNQTIDVDAFPNIADIEWHLGPTSTNTSGWKTILLKLDNFCKHQRKDCMFIADGLRAFCLDGNLKFVRKTAPQNTVANSIMPKMKYMAQALNSSYSAGYCNWFYQKDNATEDFFWCPPSIKAAGVYIYCDTYFHPWSAPAGLTRGIINDAVDIAFVPFDNDADQMYVNQWNYAMSYPIEGIAIEGHKTFQTDKTALDRVNVRRLMLYLEKRIGRIARRFVYEGNTPYLRNSFVDACSSILEDAVKGDGVKEYAIKCDDELNTPQVIENNELRCRIAVKPVKVVDFIVVDLISTRQNTFVSEEVLR